MRLLHTMLRVGNLDASLKFYCELLGMKLLRQKDYPGGEFTLAFVGYGDEVDHSVIELTHNWGQDKYDLGNAYGHIALGVDDIYSTCEQIKSQDGYKVELIQLGTQGTKQASSAQMVASN